jgi:hypothetical protein
LAQFEIFLLLGIAIGIVSIIRIFSSAVDGTRPRISVLFLFVGIGLYYYASKLAGKTLGPTDITTALANMFGQLTG